jgi:Ion transport protein
MPNIDVSSMLKKSNQITNQIESRYKMYLANVLKEASANFNGGKAEEYMNKAHLKEVSDIRVGLEYFRFEATAKKLEMQKSNIELRSYGNKIKRFMYVLSEAVYFEYFMAVAIVLNTLILSLDRYPINIAQTSVIEKVNIFFTCVFLIEMIIKLIAMGILNYFRGSLFNVFDSGIVIASIVDIFLSNILISGDSESSGSVITALRGFRLLRIFKLAKSWKRFELLLETLGRTLKDIATFSILLFLCIFTFTLLGLELFANRAKYDLDADLVDPESGQSPLFNFDDFLHSFTTVFVVLTNDGISAIYYDHYRAVDGNAATVFFVLLVIIGQKILLNLFLAILLENFDEGTLK